MKKKYIKNLVRFDEKKNINKKVLFDINEKI